MSDSLFVKAGAVILTAAGVLGVAYGIAKYVTDFEAAKAEIQNLRGQIAQLHEVLSKAQFGQDASRIERLERQVADLLKAEPASSSAAATPSPSPSPAASSAPTPAPAAPAPQAVPTPSVETRLKAGGFDGVATDGQSTWPFRATDVKLEGTGEFEAVVAWTTLNAEHRIRGRYTRDGLFFKEVEFVRKGNNVLGCEYTLNAVRGDGLSGTYRNCDENAAGGTIDVTWW